MTRKKQPTLSFYVLNDDGEPEHVADPTAWAVWVEKHSGQLAIASTLAGSAMVTTTFIGMTVVRPGEAPHLWQTKVWGGVWDHHAREYASRKDAEAGHIEMVEQVRFVESRRLLNGRGPT